MTRKFVFIRTRGANWKTTSELLRHLSDEEARTRRSVNWVCKSWNSSCVDEIVEANERESSSSLWFEIEVDSRCDALSDEIMRACLARIINSNVSEDDTN